MGVTGADVHYVMESYVLESLGEIEDALCNVPLHYSGIQSDTSVAFQKAVELLRTLKAELEAMT